MSSECILLLDRGWGREGNGTAGYDGNLENIQYLVFPPSTSSSLPTPPFPLHFDLVGIGDRVLLQSHRPGSTGSCKKESPAFNSRLVSTTFLPNPRLALVHSSVSCLAPSPCVRPFTSTTTWSPCGRIHAPLSVRLPYSFIQV